MSNLVLSVYRRPGASVLVAALLWLAAGCGASPRATPSLPAPSSSPGSTASSAGSPTTASDGVTLIYWEEDAGEAGALLDELAAEFMGANPGITVEREHRDPRELREQVRIQSLGGQPPDLVRARGEFAGSFSELGVVKALDGLFPSDALDPFFSGALAGATAGGKLWGLPDNYGSHLVLLYNTALVSSVPISTDAWLVQLEALTDAANGQYGLVFPHDASYWLIPWLAGHGGWPLDAQGQPALDTVEMVEALRFLRDLRSTHQVMPEVADDLSAFELFRQGKAVTIIEGAWNLERYEGIGLGVGIALLPLVSRTNLLPAPMAAGRYWFISAQVAGVRLEAARRFVAFMTSAEAQSRWLTALRRLPSREDAADDGSIAADPMLSGLLAQLRVARGIPPALEMACAWQGIEAHLPAVMAGEIDPEEAARGMQAEAESCIADMGNPAASRAGETPPPPD